MHMVMLRDAVYGAAVGDALGVPFEFCKRDTYKCKGMVGNLSWDKPAGTWSDDTSMLLATCDSLRENGGKVDIADMFGRFRSWQQDSAYTVDGLFDIGNTTAQALLAGHGIDDVQANGNGSLMRIVPLAFVDASDEEIEAVSSITHAHEVSRHACVNFVHVARNLMDGANLVEAVEAAPYLDAPFGRLVDIAKAGSAWPASQISSTGYVLHTLEAALWCLSSTKSYKACVIQAVNLGSDTDTTACVAGALAGIVYGADAIPAAWLETLRGKDIIERCLF